MKTTLSIPTLLLGACLVGGCDVAATPLSTVAPTFSPTAIQLQADYPTVLTVRSRSRVLAFVRGTNGGPLSGVRLAISASVGATVTPAEAMTSESGMVEIYVETDRETVLTVRALDQAGLSASLTLPAIVPINIAVGSAHPPQLAIGQSTTFLVGVENLDPRVRTTSTRIEFGDGASDVLGPGEGSYAPSHAYRQVGVYRVTAVATVVFDWDRTAQIRSNPFVVMVR